MGRRLSLNVRLREDTAIGEGVLMGQLLVLLIVTLRILVVVLRLV